MKSKAIPREDDDFEISFLEKEIICYFFEIVTKAKGLYSLEFLNIHPSNHDKT